MLQRIRIQILDNPMHSMILDMGELNESVKNKLVADRLKSEMNSSYPSLVSVEYIDLFEDEREDFFPEIKQLLNEGEIKVPVVIINGIPRIHGGIPSAVIIAEVEKIMSSGPVH